jgi:tetratricopeptide (TPR) repeat protein
MRTLWSLLVGTILLIAGCRSADPESANPELYLQRMAMHRQELNEDREAAVERYLEALRENPRNRESLERIRGIYEYDEGRAQREEDEDERSRIYGESYLALERADEILRPLIRKPLGYESFRLLLARAALGSGRLDKAQQIGQELLDQSNRGFPSGRDDDQMHEAHQLLGQAAVRRGDIEEATWRLHESAKTKGAPRISSFGPGIRLAHELLEKGEFEAVEQYLLSARTFWEMDGGRVDRWVEAIRDGRVPEDETWQRQMDYE